MSIIRRIFLGYLLLAVLFVVFTAVFGLGVVMIYNSNQRARDRSDRLIADAEDVYAKVNDATYQFRLDALQYKVQKNTGGGGGADYAALVQKIQPAVDKLEKDAWDDETRALAAGLQQKLDDFAQAATDLDSVTGAGADSGTFAVGIELAVTRADEARLSARSLVEATRKKAAAESRSATVNANRFASVMEVGFTVGAVLAFLFAFFQPRGIARRLRGLMSELSTSAAEMLSVASQVSASAMQTATAVSQAATTIDEVRQTSLLTSQKATTVSDNARSTDEVAESGRSAVGKATERMTGIHDQMGLLSQSVASLTDQTEAANEIISTIHDIAEQSRLLSVNASIEAVIAAEHGRGFNVVAEEIKNLAVQSKQGVVQVRTVLNEIQKATSAAVMAVEQSGHTIEMGVQEIDGLREAIEALADSVGAAAQSALQIEASAQQQLVGVDQISDAMGSIDQATGQNAAGARQLETEAEHLQQMAHRLRHLIAHGEGDDRREDATDAEPPPDTDDSSPRPPVGRRMRSSLSRLRPGKRAGSPGEE